MKIISRFMEGIGKLARHELSGHGCCSQNSVRGQLISYRLCCSIHKFMGFIQNDAITIRQDRMRIYDFNGKQGVISNDDICRLCFSFCVGRKTLRAKGTYIGTDTFSTRDTICRPYPAIYFRSIIAISGYPWCFGPCN